MISISIGLSVLLFTLFSYFLPPSNLSFPLPSSIPSANYSIFARYLRTFCMLLSAYSNASRTNSLIYLKVISFRCATTGECNENNLLECDFLLLGELSFYNCRYVSNTPSTASLLRLSDANIPQDIICCKNCIF